jgi:hypothetical protein
MPASSTPRIEIVLAELSRARGACFVFSSEQLDVEGQAQWRGRGMGRGRGKGEGGGHSTWKVCLLKLRWTGLESGGRCSMSGVNEDAHHKFLQPLGKLYTHFASLIRIGKAQTGGNVHAGAMGERGG